MRAATPGGGPKSSTSWWAWNFGSSRFGRGWSGPVAHSSSSPARKPAKSVRASAAEAGEVGAGERAPGEEVREREEVHALHVVVVAQRRVDARDGAAQRRGHLLGRPRERLDAPLLPAAGVELERLVHAVREHDAAHREAERLEPLVHLDDVLRRRAALRDLDRVADAVGVDERARERVGLPRLVERREAPEAAVRERERGDGVVAARHGHHVAEDAGGGVVRRRGERGLGDDDDGVAVLEAVPDAVLEDEGVVEEVEADERPRPPPRLDRDGLGVARRARHQGLEELPDLACHVAVPRSR